MEDKSVAQDKEAHDKRIEEAVVVVVVEVGPSVD